MASPKRKVLSLEQRMDVLKRLDNGQSCRSVAIMCGCGKSQIARVRLERAEIEREWASGGRCELKYLKRRKTLYEDLNALVWKWFSTARSKELPVSGRMIQVCFIKNCLGHTRPRSSCILLDKYKYNANGNG